VGNTKPYFIVANKVDLCDELEIKEKMLFFGNKVCIPASAHQKINLDRIRETIIDFLPIRRAYLTVPSNSEVMSFISWLYDQAFVLDQQQVNSEISFEIEASSQVIAKAKKYVDDLKGSFIVQNAA
jgi:50S ribosomal subunit-associated GTPase HflX